MSVLPFFLLGFLRAPAFVDAELHAGEGFQAVQEEFFAMAFRETLYTSVETLQVDLDAWLHHNNYGRPYLGYRDQGHRPWDTVSQVVRKDA